MAEWNTIKVGDIGQIITGKTPKTSNSSYYGGKIPFLTPSDDMSVKYVRETKKSITEDGRLSVKNATLPANAVCVSCIGSDLGKVVITTEMTVTNQQINSIVVDEDNYDIDYIYYAMVELGKILNFHSKTSTAVPIVNKSSFSQYELKCPPLEIQKKIGKLLSSIDSKIEENERINNNLEQQARLLFKSWFVDFEPFNGTMPSDWEVVPFETIVDFQNGYAFKSKELLNEPSSDCYQVFKQGHIARGGGFIPNGTKSWYPKKLASKLEKFVLKKGDILMAMTDMKDNVAILGNTAIMPIENEYIVNQRVGHLRANGYKGITYPFIYLLTNSTDFLIDLRSRANSGVQVNLSSAEIKASQTVLPSEKVNTAFSEITLSMFEAIISNQLENQRLAQLRDTLLPKLMSGELDVSDIDL